LESLKHHHRRHDPWRDTIAPYLLEEVGEFLIGKQAPAVSMQQGVDRVRRQPLGTESRRIPK
ncbi:MAG: hypothetical protein ACOX6T_27200, partial [Myxococcales bacterium]